MHEVPKQLMGRTQNVINFSSIVFQLALTMAVGRLCEHISLAMGFYVLASVYLVAGVLATIVTRITASGTTLEPPSAETEALIAIEGECDQGSSEFETTDKPCAAGPQPKEKKPITST